MINFLLLAVLLGVTYFVAQEGPHGAVITFFAVIISGLLSMNFFEPLAVFLANNLLGSYEWQHRWDIVALLGIFSAGVFTIRTMGDNLFPTYAQVGNLMYEISRWGLGLATGYVTMAVLLTAMHVAPLPREFLGFAPEANNFLSVAAPDRQWLAFTQYVSEKSLKASGTPRIFDGATFPSNPTDLSTQRVWSSFPIRYAARREQFTTGGRGPAAASPTAPPVVAPAGGTPVGGASGF